MQTHLQTFGGTEVPSTLSGQTDSSHPEFGSCLSASWPDKVRFVYNKEITENPDFDWELVTTNLEQAFAKAKQAGASVKVDVALAVHVEGSVNDIICVENAQGKYTGGAATS